MAVEVEQVIEAQPGRQSDGPVTVSVVTLEGPVLSEVEVALAEGETESIVLTVPTPDDPFARVGELTAQAPGPVVLVMPPTATLKEMKAVLRSGVAGLVRSSEIDSSLVATVRAVQGGQLAVPLELGRQIAKPVLSRRQKQVLGLVVLGLSNGEIAAKLHLSEHTVKCHLYSGFRKLGVSSRDEAVARILDPEGGLGTGILAISEAEPNDAARDHG